MQSPPAPQPKHLNVWVDGQRWNDGAFSSWNGQSALSVVLPERRNGTKDPIRSTRSVARFTRSMSSDTAGGACSPSAFFSRRGDLFAGERNERVDGERFAAGVGREAARRQRLLG